MPATFNLELVPGQHVALDVQINSDELDMARMEDGTMVDGMFWGKLDIIHNKDEHSMEFSGTRLPPHEDFKSGFKIDSRVMSKLAVAAKPVTAKCNLSILTPAVQYCDVILSFSHLWQLGSTWPPAERVAENKVKYFSRVHPGGAIEHFESEMVTTALYYEAMYAFTSLLPISDLRLFFLTDPTQVWWTQANMSPLETALLCLSVTSYPISRMSSINLAFPFTHAQILSSILSTSSLLPVSHRAFPSNSSNLASFAQHKNIAYRFLNPTKVASAIDISVSADPCVFTRLFLIYRGLSDDEVGLFAAAGEKEANAVNWREIVGWTEDSKDPALFRVLETSVLEVT